MNMNLQELKRVRDSYREFAANPRGACEPSVGEAAAALDYAVTQIEYLKQVLRSKVPTELADAMRQNK